MRTLLIILGCLLLAGSDLAAEGKLPELKFSEVGLQLIIRPPGAGRGLEKISVVITNMSARDGTFRLPSPFVADGNSTNLFAGFPPWIGLLVIEPRSGRDEKFVLTGFAPVHRPSKLVSLRKGEFKRIEYRSSSFYRWGSCNPDRYGSFKDYLKAGDMELEVCAVIFHEADDIMIRSAPQKLRCSLPDWLFKRPPKNSASGDSFPA